MASALAKLRKFMRRHFLHQAAADFDRKARAALSPASLKREGRSLGPFSPVKGRGKAPAGKSLARPIAAALRDQGYAAAIADKAAREARGSDFGARLRDALARAQKARRG